MFSALQTLTHDHEALGRVDALMLTDQQCMELFFTPDSIARSRSHLGGVEGDACTWDGVHCDFNARITRIIWTLPIQVCGSIDFPRLPPQTAEIQFMQQNLYGCFCMTSLPPCMESFWVIGCGLTGTLDLGALPPNLQYLHIRNNKAESIVNVCNLPENLRIFTVSEPNVINQSIAIGKLPGTNLKLKLYKYELIFENKADAERITFESS